MPEADPITVRFEADSSDLVSGTNEATKSLQTFGSASQSISGTIRSQTTDVRGLFRAMIEVRVAMMSAERVMKDFGMSSKEVSSIMGG